ncbi:MAG: hypothetical protein Q4A62_02710 [Eikenella sp.]|nr:hypothetical protein [Eikenella sp.]
MSPARRYLWLTALCTLLFLLLLLIGSRLLLEKQAALAALSFIAAFCSVGGQMASLALFLKHKHRQALMKAQKAEQEQRS